VGARQRACGAEDCQQARHREADRAWHARHPDYGETRRRGSERAEKAEPHSDDILALLAECKGNLVRVHEELETRGIVTLSYPSLSVEAWREVPSYRGGS
jgi:hypothetical protein